MLVDVTVNSEHIAGIYYFDGGAGHLGHQDFYVLYTRSGTGSVDTSGSISMYSRDASGHYGKVPDAVVHPDLHFDASQCFTPTATATSTPVPTNTATSTPRPTSTATSTPVPTNTATPAATDTPRRSDTPLPSSTPAQVTAAATVPGGGSGPTASATPPSPTSSAVPTATNTEVSIVLESVRPPTSGSAGPQGPVARFLPDTGRGPVADGIAAGLMALVVLAAGAFVLLSLGLRLRRRIS